MNKLLVTFALCVLLTSTALAESISFSFSGVVGEVLSPPPAPFALVQVGDPFQVEYTLDVSTPDQDGVDNIGTFSGAVETYTVTIGGASATTVLGGVNTVNAGALSSEDTYAAVGIFEDFTTSLSFKDPSGDAFGNEDDLSTIDLADFEDRTFILLNGLFPSVTGTLTVPEPSSPSLACFGVVWMFWRRRQR